jgi:hypothetical protein
MNFFSGVYFVSVLVGHIHNETIGGKLQSKVKELYQIVDRDGKIIYNETTDISNNFEQHFFDKYEVKVALRKYKLEKLAELIFNN